MKNFFYCLHGFLGEGSDWDGAISYVKSENFKFIKPSFFSPDCFIDLRLQSFIDDIQIQQKTDSYHKKIFMGYSLGGRIGLKILSNFPSLFDHFIFLSTHPGLIQNEEKQQRLFNDQNWANQISTNHWDQFIFNWNSQDVLKSQIQPDRKAKSFSVNKLQQGLKDWSLGHQNDYRQIISEYQSRITWVVGDRDQKFCHLAEDLKQKKTLLDYKRVSSGHRVLFENPQAIAELISNFN